MIRSHVKKAQREMNNNLSIWNDRYLLQFQAIADNKSLMELSAPIIWAC